MTALRHQLRPGAYCDSIVLLEVQKALAALPGVLDAGAVMATGVNLALLAARELLPLGLPPAAPDDLLVVVRGETGEAAGRALAEVDGLLARRRGGEGGDYRPKSLAAAVKLLPEARWVLVSVPGRWAARVAREALALGRHVFLFSDNVPLAEEVALKDEAARRGLLVLGPDCGTAWVGGVGLGFANRVRRGAVGLVAASGTGLQAVACRLHALGAGISHGLGTGGRDLSTEVGARTALRALDLLARDPGTEVIVFLSKPPAPEVAERVLAAALATGKPAVVYFQGSVPPAPHKENLRFASSLDDAAERAAELLALATSPGTLTRPATPHPDPLPAGEGAPTRPADRDGSPRSSSAGAGLRRDFASTAARPARLTADRISGPRHAPTGRGRFLRGLFSGGTLAYETLLALAPRLAPLHSNLKAAGVLPLANLAASQAHTILDLGDDAFTVGRLHPMMDPALLLARLRQEAADPEVGAVLFDVVLGYGAHPDPAVALAPAVAEMRGRRPELGIVAMLVGTDEDPQGLAGQVERLEAAGAQVVASVREAMERLLSAVAMSALAGDLAKDTAGGSERGPATTAEAGEDPKAAGQGAQEAAHAPLKGAPTRLGLPAEDALHTAATALRGASTGLGSLASDDLHLELGAAETRPPQSTAPPVALDALASPVAAINVGLETFHASLVAQGAAAVQVEWRPPAGGNERLLDLLDRMRGSSAEPGAGTLARASGRGTG